MVSLKYNVIGRTSALTGKLILKEFLRKCPRVTIISDYNPDGVGYRGACSLAEVLDCSAGIVLNEQYKDIRAWINSGTYSHQKLIDLERSV